METDSVNRQIGKKIRDLRNQKGLTQQELADRTELTKGYISQLEHGLAAPSVITLLDLIECLGSTPAEFFAENEPEQVVFSENGFFEKFDEPVELIGRKIDDSRLPAAAAPTLLAREPQSVLPKLFHRFLLSGFVQASVMAKICFAPAF